MQKQELKKQDEKSDSRQPSNDAELPTISPQRPIEPDPMNPVQPRDVEPEHGERPDLDWAEHED